MRNWAGGLAGAAVLVWLGTGPGLAEPLAKEACEALKGEHAGLVQAGLPDVLTKGPEWGRDNLDKARLAQVRRYIELEELLGFRCGLARARLTLPVAEEDVPSVPPAEKGETKDKPVAAPKPGHKPVPKSGRIPGQKPAAKPVVKDAAVAPPKAPAAATAKPKPPPKAAVRPDAKPAKAKSKSDDAYRPPAPAKSDADPFAKPAAPKPPA